MRCGIGQKTLAKPGIDFIAGARDARPDGGNDPVSPGAERHHGGDRRASDVMERALPAGMRGADHPGLGIGEQDRGAIGSQDAQRQARRGGDQRIGLRAVGIGTPRRHRHHNRAVDLMHCHQRCTRGDRRDGTGAVFADRRRIIAGADPDIQAGEDSARNAAAPPKKAVADAQSGGGNQINHHSIARHRISSSA